MHLGFHWMLLEYNCTRVQLIHCKKWNGAIHQLTPIIAIDYSWNRNNHKHHAHISKITTSWSRHYIENNCNFSLKIGPNSHVNTACTAKHLLVSQYLYRALILKRAYAKVLLSLAKSCESLFSERFCQIDTSKLATYGHLGWASLMGRKVWTLLTLSLTGWLVHEIAYTCTGRILAICTH